MEGGGRGYARGVLLWESGEGTIKRETGPSRQYKRNGKKHANLTPRTRGRARGMQGQGTVCKASEASHVAAGLCRGLALFGDASGELAFGHVTIIDQPGS